MRVERISVGTLEAKEGRRLGITGNPDYAGTPFTDFASVTRRTKVQDLNLNWRECDLRERERTKHVHRLHPYLGKFVPQLVEIFLRKYKPETVCDPFSGSGTTLVEANALGIKSFGCDISEFNCLLTRVKVADYDLDVLEHEINDIVTRLHLELQPTLHSNGYAAKRQSSTEYLREWFAPESLAHLLFFKSLIADYTYQDLLKVILSRAARSARLTTHFDLDFPRKPQTEPYHCHKHSRTCRPVQEARKFLVRYSLDTLRRVKKFAAVKTDVRTQVGCKDSRKAKFGECDMVITSPPYVGLIDYHEQHRYAYELLDLEAHETDEIGAASGGSSRRAVDSYVGDMTAAFENVIKYLRPGGRIVVVVHDRRDLYDEISERIGVKTEYRLGRHVNRRTGRRGTDFFEDVIVWKR